MERRVLREDISVNPGRRLYDREAVVRAARLNGSIPATAREIGCTAPCVRQILRVEAPDLLAEIVAAREAKMARQLCPACELESVKDGDRFCSEACRAAPPVKRSIGRLAKYEIVYQQRLAGKSWAAACAAAGVAQKSMYGAPQKVRIWGARTGTNVTAAFGFVGVDIEMS